MNAWRNIRVTIIVEIEGEQPLRLTQTYENLHMLSAHNLIEDMADAFRVEADPREQKKPCNERWMPMVKAIKRIPYSKWAATDFHSRKVVDDIFSE